MTIQKPGKRRLKKKGPKPERVKISGNWEDAVGQALKKERPKAGWPTLPRGNGGSVYEEDCMRHIADFIVRATQEHRAASQSVEAQANVRNRTDSP